MKNSIQLTWMGHSCFLASYEGYTLVLDPFSHNTVPGLSPLSIQGNQVLCSHLHHDHHGVETVSLLSGQKNPFQIEAIPTFHDPEQGALRGTNTIHIFSAGGIRIAHLGDLGCDLSQEQMQKLQGLTALLVPVGGFYTINAQQANHLAEALSPTVIIPMHYRSDTFGYDCIGTLEEFLSLRTDCVFYPGNSIEITSDMPSQTAVLTYAP